MTATMRRVWLIPAALACGSVLVSALLKHPPDSIRVDMAQPVVVATNWHDFGKTLWLLIFGSIVVASAPYLAMVQSIIRRRETISITQTALVCALSLGVCLTMPVILSSDVYAYAAYGWMDLHGISPYAHTALSMRDPLIRAAVWQWSNPLPICVYGPLFVWIAKICVIAGATLGTTGQLFLLRLISCAGLVACAPLVYWAMPGFRHDERVLAAAGIALNPVAIWVAAEGHNDTLVLALVLCGFIALRKAGYFAGAFIIAAAALIKANSVAAAFMLALYSLHDRSRWIRVLAGIGCGIAVTALVARPFESGVSTVLVPHGHYAPQFSMQSIAAALLQPVPGLGQYSLECGIAIALVGAGLVALNGVRRILRRERDGAAWLALALWFAIPNPYPWYALWILPAAFLCIRKPVAWAIVAASITIFLRYLPDVSSNGGADTALVVAACEFAFPIAILCFHGRSLNRPLLLEADTSP